MGDEGIGVHVVNALEKADLLEPMQNAEKVILIDATMDGRPTGTIRRLTPRFSADYPPTLTAHDIGLKDLLDAFYLMGDRIPEVSLYAISIPPLSDMCLELSPHLHRSVECATGLVRDEAWDSFTN